MPGGAILQGAPDRGLPHRPPSGVHTLASPSGLTALCLGAGALGISALGPISRVCLPLPARFLLWVVALENSSTYFSLL